jgi:hypothetical protein
MMLPNHVSAAPVAAPQTQASANGPPPTGSPRRYAMMDAARKLGTSHFRLFGLARDAGLLDEHNRPTRRATERGLFLPRTIRANSGSQEIIRASATVPPAGIQWLNERLYGPDREAHLAGIATGTLGRLMQAADHVLRDGACGDGIVGDEALADLADALDSARAETETADEPHA